MWLFVTCFYHLAWCVQSSFMLWHVSVLHYCSVIFIIWLCHILVFHSSVDDHTDCFYFLVIMGNVAVPVHIKFCADLCFQLSWVCAYKWKCWIYVVTLYLTFWVAFKLFAKVPVPIYNATHNVWGLQFLCIPVSTFVCPFFFLVAIH